MDSSEINSKITEPQPSKDDPNFLLWVACKMCEIIKESGATIEDVKIEDNR